MGDDAGNVLFELWLTSRVVTDVLDTSLRPSGLTADEFAVYSVLSAGPLTPGELARWMSAPLSTVTSYVRRFEARGSVQRVPNDQDGRSYLLQLTEEGHLAHQRAGALFLDVLSGVEAELGRSTAATRTALRELTTALHKVRTPSG